jgi:hypothetical protein
MADLILSWVTFTVTYNSNLHAEEKKKCELFGPFNHYAEGDN